MREGLGFKGGAMDAGFAGGAMTAIVGWADALCAEFMAGNDGGGRLSSSSSSELSCSFRVKVGIALPLAAPLGAAFGVAGGDKTGLSGFSLGFSVML
jgi:hypothetical protein